MKKDVILEIILGTIGGLVFAIGMCMCLIPEWHLFKTGVIVTAIGFIMLLCIIPIYKKSHPSKPRKPINWGFTTTWVIGIIGALVMGFGMSKTMVNGASQSEMIIGIITGIIGLIVCVLDFPIYSYFEKNKD